MAGKRKAYAPFSLITESGVANAPVEGYIDVEQVVQPTVNTGIVNEDGTWEGVKANDKEFKIMGTDLAIANGGHVTAPVGSSEEENFIDMTGFTSMFIALRVTNTGPFKIQAVMGAQAYPFSNLSPINEGAILRGFVRNGAGETDDLMSDGAETLTADVWNIYYLQNTLANQKVMQFKITNNSLGSSDIQFAYMRLV